MKYDVPLLLIFRQPCKLYFMARHAARNENLTYEDLLQLVELIKASPQFGEFHLKAGDMEVHLRRKTDAHAVVMLAAAREPPHPVQRHGHAGGGEIVVEPPEPAPAHPARRDAPAGFPEGSVVIRSPMVGTFYLAPEPGARPFVEAGQRVEPETTVCIIEVMKLMNSIPAGAKGVVKEVLVADMEPVEYGQPLIVIFPD